jgi:energy-converting hydrogenase Eha subunit A
MPQGGYAELYTSFLHHVDLAFNAGLICVGVLFIKRLFGLIFQKPTPRGLAVAAMFFEEIVACGLMVVSLAGLLRVVGIILAAIAGVPEVKPPTG